MHDTQDTLGAKIMYDLIVKEIENILTLEIPQKNKLKNIKVGLIMYLFTFLTNLR